MSKYDELKPCPFCGGEGCIQRHEFVGYTDTFGVVCLDCCAETRQFFTDKKVAVRAWNRRAQTSGTPYEIETSSVCKTEPSGYKMKPVEQTEPQQVTSKLADTVIPTDIERGVWDYKGKGKWAKTEPQKDCETCKHYNPHHEAIACERCLDGKYSRYEQKDEPQTDCSWK